jgi:hypothetical protein
MKSGVSKISTVPPLARLAVAITAALISQSLYADHILVLTETSSTTLTATYDGSAVGVSVINISSDHCGDNIAFRVIFFWKSAVDRTR